MSAAETIAAEMALLSPERQAEIRADMEASRAMNQDEFLAEMVASYEEEVERHKARGDIEFVELRAKRLQSIKDMQLQRERKLRKWPKQSAVAKLLGVSAPRVHQLTESGKLRTNGRTGTACRIDPEKLLGHYIDSTAATVERANLQVGVLRELGLELLHDKVKDSKRLSGIQKK